MKILVACEESQRVTKAFRDLGHEAWSCDILETSGDNPEWHIQGDALDLLNEPWDMLIAFPPCTYLSNAGATQLYPKGVLNHERYLKGLEGKAFFMKFFNAPINRICVENPIPSRIYELPERTQIIQPYWFGDPYSKKTCLWLKNLPKLVATDMCETWESTVTAKWYQSGGKNRAKNRSKIFPGIALAMAQQWGHLE